MNSIISAKPSLEFTRMTNLQPNTTIEQSAVVREPYETPALVFLGDVRDLTLGGSPGSGDSGSPGAERF